VLPWRVAGQLYLFLLFFFLVVLDCDVEVLTINYFGNVKLPVSYRMAFRGTSSFVSEFCVCVGNTVVATLVVVYPASCRMGPRCSSSLDSTSCFVVAT
jgi:hypothetical protein